MRRSVRFMASTNRVRIKFSSTSAHIGAFVISTGNGVPWMCLFASGGTQKLGAASVAYEGNNTFLLTVNQWSDMIIVPMADIKLIESV